MKLEVFPDNVQDLCLNNESKLPPLLCQKGCLVSVCLYMSFIVFSRDIPLVQKKKKIPLWLSSRGKRPSNRMSSCCLTESIWCLGLCLSCSSSGIPGSECDHVLRGLRGDPGCAEAEVNIAVMVGMTSPVTVHLSQCLLALQWLSYSWFSAGRLYVCKKNIL